MSGDPLFTRRNAEFAARADEYAGCWIEPLGRLQAGLQAVWPARRPAPLSGSPDPEAIVQSARAGLVSLNGVIREAGLAGHQVDFPPVPAGYRERERAGRRAAAGLYAAAAAGDWVGVDGWLDDLKVRPDVLDEVMIDWHNVISPRVLSEWHGRNVPVYLASVEALQSGLGLPEAEVRDENRHLLRPPRWQEGQSDSECDPGAPPHWDGVTVTWRGRSKRVATQARVIRAILGAFQRRGWPATVADAEVSLEPGDDRRGRITDAVHKIRQAVPFLSFAAVPGGVRWDEHPSPPG